MSTIFAVSASTYDVINHTFYHIAVVSVDDVRETKILKLFGKVQQNWRLDIYNEIEQSPLIIN
jgi:hypothetical protein